MGPIRILAQGPVAAAVGHTGSADLVPGSRSGARAPVIWAVGNCSMVRSVRALKKFEVAPARDPSARSERGPGEPELLGGERGRAQIFAEFRTEISASRRVVAGRVGGRARVGVGLGLGRGRSATSTAGRPVTRARVLECASAHFFRTEHYTPVCILSMCLLMLMLMLAGCDKTSQTIT